MGYAKEYAASIADPAAYWGKKANELLDWASPWQKVLDGDFAQPEREIRWFEGGRLNVAVQCLDRHAAHTPDKAALIWVPDDPEAEAVRLTYAELTARVRRFAAVLQAEGVKAGDVVTLYLPMIPEAAIAMLACARIGAMHSVVFGGFSPESLKSRIEDAGSRIVVTADEGPRAGKRIALKANVDRAVEGTSVERVIVVRRTGGRVAWHSRDRWWHELDAGEGGEPDAFEANQPLFLLYTSGSTGKPKGLRHGSAGYLLYALSTFRDAFDYREDDVFFSTADVGWITGHSYLVYGPLAAGATSVMFEGTPNWPDPSRWWRIVEEQRVSLFYTAPTAIRLLMREGEKFLEGLDLSSLRVLGTVGEPINPEAWRWYCEKIGKGRAKVVDTWWQTETGGHLILPLPGSGIDPKPGAAMRPYFGIRPELADPVSGRTVDGEGEGALCIAAPWPGMAQTIHGDHARFVETYFKPYPGHYFSGDGARRDLDGDWWITGRMDDVVNVSGHRIGTAEVESALVLHPAVTEAAVVGVPHALKGQDLHAFVTLAKDREDGEALRGELKAWVKQQVGAHAAPGRIQIAPDLPKTRSGKIMRRILRKIAAGEVTGEADYGELGDISTLLDPGVIGALLPAK